MFGFVHLYNGQEAISTGVIGAMKRNMIGFVVRIAIMFMRYRAFPHLENFLVKLQVVAGRGGSMHLFSREHHLLGGYAFIGEGIPVALGAAFSSKYRGSCW